LKLIVHPAKSLEGTVTLPGDKSISHRTLMLGAMAQGTTVAHNWLNAGVTERMVDCIRALGVTVDVDPTGPGRATLTVRGRGLSGFTQPSRPLFCGGSATTMRLLLGLLATQPFTVTLDGHDGLRRRPMERIARPLRRMGAIIETTDGHAPLTITGARLAAIDHKMPVASAQLQTSLLLAALGAEGQMTLHQPGPARDHTLRMLQGMGANIEEKNGLIVFKPEGFILQPLDFTVPGDMSSAAFLLVAGLIVPKSNIQLKQVNTNYTRAGLLEELQRMGGNIAVSNEQLEACEPVADLTVISSSLQGSKIGGDVVVRMIDEFPVFTVAALLANGKTLVRDAAELAPESSRVPTGLK
jgi:3-phosphoshikimate 1-carboxyvinyltransferase